jgi:hypothetical protein
MVSGGIDGAVRVWASKWAADEAAVEGTLCKKKSAASKSDRRHYDLNANRCRSGMFLVGWRWAQGFRGSLIFSG